MTERQALKAAKKRGLVNGAEVQAAIPKRHRRHCPACGESFLPRIPSHRGFCCACCAFDWGELRMASRLDRRIGAGVEVILLQDGAVGVVRRVLAADQAEVLMEDGRVLAAGPRDVERIQYLQVAHRADCPRNRSVDLAKRLGKKAQEGRQENDKGHGDAGRN